jgi:hypothetical protein
MKSFGRRMFPMFAMAAIAIVVASGVSVAQLDDENGATDPHTAAYDVDSCAPLSHAPVDGADGDCATTWQMLWGSKD